MKGKVIIEIENDISDDYVGQLLRVIDEMASDEEKLDFLINTLRMDGTYWFKVTTE